MQCRQRKEKNTLIKKLDALFDYNNFSVDVKLVVSALSDEDT